MTMRIIPALLISEIILSPAISGATTLTGTVVDASKSAVIPGASVSVDVLIPDSISFHAVSDSSGRYSLSEIPGGNAIYVIRCYVTGFADFYMRYDALGLGDRQVDILMYPQATTPPGDGGDSTDVSGVVLYETPGGARNPVDLALLTLTSGADQFSSQTGSDGKYSIRLRTASYALKVEAPNYETLTAGGISVDSAGLILNILLKSIAVSVPAWPESGPEVFVLEDAYPNPFNPGTTIGYSIPVGREKGPGGMETRLAVYDILGREVAVLVNEKKGAGKYTVQFDGSDLASGVYFYRLTAGNFVQTRRLLLIR